MPVEISVRADFKKAKRMLSGMRRVSVRRAAAKALNKVAGTVKTRIKRSISEQINIKQKSVNKKISIKKARRNNLVATIRGTGHGFFLEEYKVKRTKAGVKYTAFGKTTLIKSAFKRKDKPGWWKRIPSKTITVKAGVGGRHYGETTYKGPKGSLVGRLPIRRLYGAPIPAAMITKETKKVLNKTVKERWRIEFDRAIRLELRKYK